MLSGYGYFIFGHFIVGHIMRCADKTPVDKMPFKIATEDKMLILSKHLIIYCTDGQVN